MTFCRSCAAGLAVRLLPGPPRFVSRCVSLAAGSLSRAARKMPLAGGQPVFSSPPLLSSPARGLRASWCHAAGPPRRHTARPSAKNTLRRWRNCFFVCGARCAPAPGPSALRVTLQSLRDGRLLRAPPEMPPGRARPVFRSARVTAALLPALPRFVSRCVSLAAGSLSRAARKMPLAGGQPVFSSPPLLSSPARGLRASWCHAAGPPRRHTARPSAKNTLRRWRNCFFVCGARCAPAPGPSALLTP